MSIHQPPSQLNLEDASNSGSLDDLITSHNKPVLVGTAEAEPQSIFMWMKRSWQMCLCLKMELVLSV